MWSELYIWTSPTYSKHTHRHANTETQFHITLLVTEWSVNADVWPPPVFPLQWTRCGYKSQKWGSGRSPGFFPRLRTLSSAAGWASVVGKWQLWAPRQEELLLQERIVPPLCTAAFSPLRLYFTALKHCTIHSRVACFLQYLSRWLIHNRWGGCMCILLKICAVHIYIYYVKWSDTGLRWALSIDGCP